VSDDIELVDSIEAVRRRPAMYIGNTLDGSGVLHLLLEVVGNSYDQYLAGRCTTISVEIAADGALAVEDDGPGLPAEGSDRLPALPTLLTTMSGRPTVDGHRPHAHLETRGLGLFFVNALSERFELATVNAGTETRITYARGRLVEPLTTHPASDRRGTRVSFRPDPAVLRCTRVPRVELTRRLEDLAFLSPRLRLAWSIAGDDAAAGGLPSRVALEAGLPLDAVASHRTTYETPRGPISVEVALAWRGGAAECNRGPAIDSFVNLRRTPNHGSHVAGMLDGIRLFCGSDLEPDTRGLVAAVAVVLADVHYGKPDRTQLETDEARTPVALATRAALDEWAARAPERATEVRLRLRARPA
jgi:DNA gyrase subunit B